MPDTLTKPTVDTEATTEYREPGDHDKFAHYAPKEQILRSQVEGVPLRALCGKQWLPTQYAPTLPICPDCKRAYELLDPTSENTKERNS